METVKDIMIVDDHKLFRDALRTIIENDRGFEVVSEAGTAEEALLLAENRLPDMFLVDISLPDITGLQLTRRLCSMFPNVLILILTMHCRVDYVIEAFHCGARGYVVKQSSTEGIIKGIRLVSEGEYYLDSIVSPKIIKRFLCCFNQDAKFTDASFASLTIREQEVMKLLAEGFSRKEIGEALFISHKTVENHRTAIMKKLNLKSSRLLVRYAVRLGLIDLDMWRA
jgi:DNA-binding NarL/FixJ family response regulator